MDTTHAATKTTGADAATWTIQPWTDRSLITAEYKPWAAGVPCMAITAKGASCGRRGTHITPSQTILCKTHAASKYAVDCR
jgi:hypothetical protein